MNTPAGSANEPVLRYTAKATPEHLATAQSSSMLSTVFRSAAPELTAPHEVYYLPLDRMGLRAPATPEHWRPTSLDYLVRVPAADPATAAVYSAQCDLNTGEVLAQAQAEHAESGKLYEPRRLASPQLHVTALWLHAVHEGAATNCGDDVVYVIDPLDKTWRQADRPYHMAEFINVASERASNFFSNLNVDDDLAD
ncbi:uncharacterized protein ACA1_321050 [Acanthamoeba castellanii str. Neff]|uniref:Uncharacterized protein n=1 Tax=Acanthamoeba castellanii (strain ATCC 30010 / Neff) TaxID=1257118 RepID=L8GPP3_ACACF|nr:uncharacterized protein ACA1_321050 [Acanthamoeba castellanii str. Neff]ELR14588.1 hypothetical protein ACA1_321050 [Acanthamoeba castellanii str. Neff]